MTKTTTDDVIRTLRYHGGLTSEEVAQRLGVPRDRVGSKLSKLWLYGRIDRERVFGTRPIRYVYYAKERDRVAPYEP